MLIYVGGKEDIMVRAWMISVVFTYTEGAHNSVIGVWEDESTANAKKAELDALVTHARTLQAVFDEEINKWVQDNPHPHNAYQEYQEAHHKHQKAVEDLAYEKIKGDAWQHMEGRGLFIEQEMIKWEKANKHLHWTVVQEKWRQKYTTVMKDMASYKAYKNVWQPFVAQHKQEGYDATDTHVWIAPVDFYPKV